MSHKKEHKKEEHHGKDHKKEEHVGDAQKAAATDVPTWATIKSYFTESEQQCMLNVTNKQLDLFDCNSVMTWAPRIYQEVGSGAMPKGGPRWTEEMVTNFQTWWQQGNCN